MGEILKAVKERRSIRRFKNEDVSKDKIRTILEAANWAPSNANSQPWRFIVLKGEYVQKVSDVFHKWSQEYIPKAEYIPEDKKKDMLKYSKDFGGAPVLIAVAYNSYEDKNRTEEALMATCAAVQNLCLVAMEEGLGTVWIAGHVTHDNKTKEILNIESNEKITAIIPVGYPDMDPPPPKREDNLTKKVTWMGF